MYVIVKELNQTVHNGDTDQSVYLNMFKSNWILISLQQCCMLIIDLTS